MASTVGPLVSPDGHQFVSVRSRYRQGREETWADPMRALDGSRGLCGAWQAGELWHDEGWVFATPAGQPINPRTDYNEWKRMLKATGLRESRLHDARHTAATVLLVLRQPTPTVMSLMGWSSESMAARYQHVTDALRSQVASQGGELIWDSPARHDGQTVLVVRRNSLATVLAAVEECLAGHHGGTGPRIDLLAALADLRTALPPAPAPAETANETQTETRRSSEK